MQPDLLLIEGLAGAGLLKLDRLEHASERRRCQVHIVEVGYCMETAYMIKYQEKHAQHQQLITHLREAGYVEIKLQLLTFGSTGGMFHLIARHSRQSGITGPPRKMLLANLHFEALKQLEHLVETCRRLEHQPNERIGIASGMNTPRGGGGGGGGAFGRLNGRLGPTPSFACASLLA